MNANHFLHLRPQPSLAGTDARKNRHHDLHPTTKKALDRWENEGGKIPEGASNDHDHSAARGPGMNRAAGSS